MLLENFAQTKNLFAPFIYKTLTFLLIENFPNEKVRHHIVDNFIEIFQRYPDIPQSILLEPLLKQFQMSEASLECLNLFDMTLLNLIAQNKKLQIKLVIQFLDVFAKILKENFIFAKLTQNSLINLIQNYQNEDEIIEFLKKFCKYFLSSLYNDLQNTGGRINLPPITSLQNLEMVKKYLTVQKRALLVDTIKKIIIINIESLNDTLKSSILLTEYQIRQTLKTEYKGIILLLAYFGQPNELIREFDKEYNSPNIIISDSKSESSLPTSLQNKRLENITLSSLGSQQELILPSNVNSPHSNHDDGPEILDTIDSNDVNKVLTKNTDNKTDLIFSSAFQSHNKTSNNEPGKYDLMFEKKVISDPTKIINKLRFRSNLVKRHKSPNSSDTGFVSKKEAKPGQKVLDELEYIQNLYQLNKLKKMNEIEEKKIIEDKKREKIRLKLQKRRIEHGIASRNKSNVIVNLVFDEGIIDHEKTSETKNGLPEIEIIDLENEETRDKTAIDMILEKYQRTFKFLFSSYANTGVGRNANNFQKYTDDARTISLTELWRMLIEHDCKPLISKEEFVTLLRLVCTKIMKNHDIQELKYEGFTQFLVQVAIFIYSKPFKNLSHMPVFVLLTELIKHFRDSKSRKGQKTFLYDHPDAHVGGDLELEKYLNSNLKKNGDFLLPQVINLFLVFYFLYI